MHVAHGSDGENVLKLSQGAPSQTNGAQVKVLTSERTRQAAAQQTVLVLYLLPPCREPDSVFEQRCCLDRSAPSSGSLEDGRETGSGWEGHTALCPLGPSQLPGELEPLRAELGIAAVFLPEGLGQAGETPLGDQGATALRAARPESSSWSQQVSRQTRALARGSGGNAAFTTALPCPVRQLEAPLLFPEGPGLP